MTTPVTERADFDSPVLLEVLRSQLQAVADESADTVERTAISPVVTEGKDYGSVLLDATGNLLAGGGTGSLHWVGATRAVRSTIERYGDTIEDGDVYLANDPYNGGGLHPADVMVQRPIFVGGVLVAWSALSAHLIDMGGMAVGSWTPHATDCYMEAFRIPPVRLLKRGEEVSDVWDVFRVNVRFSMLVEMDVRGLIAGSYVARTRIVELVEHVGLDWFVRSTAALIELSSRELVRRISQLEPGTYRSTNWTEWGDEFVSTPCALTVTSDRLIFDFEGAHEQIPFFINSKPYIIKAIFMRMFTPLLAADLPYNEGLLRPIEMRCPEGTVVNSVEPAPVNCGHMHLGFTAAETMTHCVRLAIWSSPRLLDSVPSTGFDGTCAVSPNSYSARRADGTIEAWMMLDGLMLGQSAAPERDGVNFAASSVDLPGRAFSQPTPLDVESYELWYPMLLHERKAMSGDYGAGRWRSGASLRYTFEPHETTQVNGQMLGYRGRLPLPGVAGGLPGSVARMTVQALDGSLRSIAMNDSSLAVAAGETFTLDNASGGGWGDPLDREAEVVADDVAAGRIGTGEALDVHGVVLVDGLLEPQQTESRRAALRGERLRDATPAAKAVDGSLAETLDGPVEGEPIFPGIVQRGNVTYAAQSGAPLAVSPDHWTDGCPVLRRVIETQGIELRSYLDPTTGRALQVEPVPIGAERSFSSEPQRWLSAAGEA